MPLVNVLLVSRIVAMACVMIQLIMILMAAARTIVPPLVFLPTVVSLANVLFVLRIVMMANVIQRAIVTVDRPVHQTVLIVFQASVFKVYVRQIVRMVHVILHLIMILAAAGQMIVLPIAPHLIHVSMVFALLALPVHVSRTVRMPNVGILTAVGSMIFIKGNAQQELVQRVLVSTAIVFERV